MDKDQKGRWKRIPKPSFSSKALAKRMKKVEGATVRHARKFVFQRVGNIRDVRRHIITWILVVGLLIGATGLQLLWYQNSYRTSAAATDGTYAEAVLGPVNTLNPLFASSSAEQSFSRLAFSRLLSYDTAGTLNNDLAASVSVDSAKKVYTVTMRPDVKWHDGFDLTAKDVVFTIGLLKNSAVRSTITGWNDVAVTALDDRTVQFTLPAVYAAFPHAMTFPVLPEHILKDVEPSAVRESQFSQSPVGSGPFRYRFTQTIDDTANRRIVHLSRNTGFYQGVPRLDRLQLHVYGTREAITKALSTSEVNAASDLSVGDTTKISKDRYDILKKPLNSGVYALFNNNAPILKDKAVRQALQVGTDTNALRRSVGTNIPALSLPFVNDQVAGDLPTAPSYDQAAARRLLDQAGWVLDGSVRKKDGVELQLAVVTVKDSDFERTLETLSGQWRELGIVVTTQIVDPNSADPTQNFIKTVQDRQYDVLIYQLTIGGDPDVYAYWHSSQANATGFNFSNYASPVSDDALASARSRVEPEVRNPKYATFARQWLADAPAIGLYQSTLQYVTSKSVMAVDRNSSLTADTDRYGNVLYWSVGDQTVFKTP